MNTYKPSRRAAPEEKKKSFMQHLLEYNFDFSGGSDEWAIRYVPYFVFITILGILYIANTYYSERLTTQITEIDKEVEVLKVDYSTMKYEYIKESRLEEVSRKVKQLGLRESDEPAYKIEVEDWEQE